MGRMLLVRHCESMGQQPDAALTASGAAAAVALAGPLAAFQPDAIYSSPYRRAMATVEPLAARSGQDVRTDMRLSERVLSEEPLADWLAHLNRSFEDGDYRLPKGESLNQAQARGLAALLDIATVGHRLPVIASHGNLISALLRSVDPAFGFEDWRTLRNPDLFELTHDGGRLVAFVRINLSG